jgi:hypothetical protein
MYSQIILRGAMPKTRVFLHLLVLASREFSVAMPREKKWFPLESNPALLNSYISNLGFSTVNYAFTDVYSTDDWALAMIQPPVLALVVLLPMSSRILERRQEMHKVAELNMGSCDGVWFIKQRISNACGTIGERIHHFTVTFFHTFGY